MDQLIILKKSWSLLDFDNLPNTLIGIRRGGKFLKWVSGRPRDFRELEKTWYGSDRVNPPSNYQRVSRLSKNDERFLESDVFPSTTFDKFKELKAPFSKSEWTVVQTPHRSDEGYFHFNTEVKGNDVVIKSDGMHYYRFENVLGVFATEGVSQVLIHIDTYTYLEVRVDSGDIGINKYVLSEPVTYNLVRQEGRGGSEVIIVTETAFVREDSSILRNTFSDIVPRNDKYWTWWDFRQIFSMYDVGRNYANLMEYGVNFITYSHIDDWTMTVEEAFRLEDLKAKIRRRIKEALWDILVLTRMDNMVVPWTNKRICKFLQSNSEKISSLAYEMARLKDGAEILGEYQIDVLNERVRKMFPEVAIRDDEKKFSSKLARKNYKLDDRYAMRERVLDGQPCYLL